MIVSHFDHVYNFFFMDLMLGLWFLASSVSIVFAVGVPNVAMSLLRLMGVLLLELHALCTFLSTMLII